MKTNPHVGMTFEECYKKHKKIIHKVVSKQLRGISNIYSMDKEDLMQIALLGFMKAYEEYDSKFNSKFNSYAYDVMRWTILKTLRTKRDIISFPQSFNVVWSIASRHHYTIHNLEEILKHKPSNLSEAQIKRAMEWYGNNIPISLDGEIAYSNKPENDKLLYEIVKGSENDISQAVVDEFLTTLTTKQEMVVIYLLEGMTQTEIAKKLDITQPQVCRIIKSIQKAWKKYEGRDGEC